MPATSSLVAPAPVVLASPRIAARRAERAAAFALDLAACAGAVILATLLALAWLFVRTGWGGVRVAEGDSIIAAALIGAAIPAWLAWLALSVHGAGATPGQHSRRLYVRVGEPGLPAARLLRLGLHPVSIPAWLWLAAATWLVVLPLLPALFAAIAATIACLGVASAILVLHDPTSRGVHDRLAGTRIVRVDGLAQ